MEMAPNVSALDTSEFNQTRPIGGTTSRVTVRGPVPFQVMHGISWKWKVGYGRVMTAKAAHVGLVTILYEMEPALSLVPSELASQPPQHAHLCVLSRRLHLALLRCRPERCHIKQGVSSFPIRLSTILTCTQFLFRQGLSDYPLSEIPGLQRLPKDKEIRDRTRRHHRCVGASGRQCLGHTLV